MFRCFSVSFASLLLAVSAETWAQDGGSDLATREITVTGERVCLPSIPDEDGRIELSCAIGLRGDDDRYYGLRLADPSKRIGPLPVINERVRVRGYFIPSSDGRYEVAGDIVYTSIELIDDPKVVVGTLLCIDEREADVSLAQRCRSAIQTAGGRFWGLEASSFDAIANELALTAGMRVEVEAELVSEWPTHWHPWASRGSPRRVEGLLNVKQVRVVQ